MKWIADQIAALRGDDFPAAVIALVALVLLGVAAWALLVGGLACSPRLRGLAVALTPRILRGLVFAGVAGALSVPAAHADERGALDGLRLPDRPLIAGTAQAPHPATTVVVQPGDTLWAIAQARLGTGADAASTVRAVRRWHDANRDVIGADPDLIRPGQKLTAPPEDRS